MPPPWAFGPWISSDIWRSGGEVRYAVTQFRERGLPASAFVFDSPWEIAYNDFKFNMTQFAKDATIDGVDQALAGRGGELSQQQVWLRADGVHRNRRATQRDDAAERDSDQVATEPDIVADCQNGEDVDNARNSGR